LARAGGASTGRLSALAEKAAIDSGGVRKTLVSFVLPAAGVLILLYLVSLEDYLLFHAMAEMFSIVIAFSIFVLAWNSRRFMENGCLLFIGIAYVFVGGLDIMHTLAYGGMGLLPGSTNNLATQLWVAARYIQSTSLLVAPLFLTRRLRVHIVFSVLAVGVALILASIFYWHNFPVCYIEGRGLTTFKRVSEYVISGILAGSIVAFTGRRQYFDSTVFRFLMASLAVTIASELCFTLYFSVYASWNLAGHCLKILAFYLLYKAFIETGLRRPFDLLFREVRLRERALVQSESKFRSLAEYAPDMIISMDRDLALLYANPAVGRLAGMAPEDLIGKSLKKVPLPAPLREALAEMAHRVRGTGRMETTELDVPLTVGRKYFRLAVVPEGTPDGPPDPILVVATDITELKEAERISRRDKETLEGLVIERSRELLEAQRKLQEAKRLSDVGTLAATVAHELRNPLGVIQTALYNIRRKNKDESLERNLANIEKKVAESKVIINSLLRYARVRPLDYEDASLVCIIGETLAAARDRFPDYSVEVTADLDPIRDKIMKIDVVQIREVFDNIINNAYQAVDADGGRINVVGRMDDGDTISVSIVDDGDGMTPEDLEHAFEPFYTRKSRGTGLGLTVCKEIVGLHGGKIHLESRQGSGTVVNVILPL
jgi:PAS domain S-box-containing protein